MQTKVINISTRYQQKTTIKLHAYPIGDKVDKVSQKWWDFARCLHVI